MTRTSCLWTAKYIFKYLFEKKGNLFDFLPSFFNCLLKINRYWTTVETLAEIERGCNERQLCMGDWINLSGYHL